ncbi:MAG TPA: ABC transporter permease [Acidimicrobiia bacterium]|nr:ABC transporter permease [Acidimicrobiia bacterium]
MATTVQRSLRAGFWLGWKIESNWADPLLFLIYSVIRPLGSALILVVMFFAVSGGRRGPLLDFFVVGSAFWPLVLAGLQGLVTAVLEDRELWRMTRSVYTSPISWPTFLIGRTLAATLSAGFGGVVVILLTGRLFLGVPLTLSPGDIGLLAAVVAAGLAAILALGMLTVAGALMAASDAWHLPEAISASLYLVAGAVFPVALLPAPLQAVARALPLTWWLEALRRLLLPAGARLSFPSASDGTVLALLGVTTAAAVAAATVAFRLAERRARRLGLLDRDSGF